MEFLQFNIQNINYNKCYIFYTFTFLFRLNTISVVCSYKGSLVLFALIQSGKVGGVRKEKHTN